MRVLRETDFFLLGAAGGGKQKDLISRKGVGREVVCGVNQGGFVAIVF